MPCEELQLEMDIQKKIVIIVNVIIITGCCFTYCVNAQEDRFVNKIGMTFVYIPSGTFLMGSPENERWRKKDETLHQVTISKGYYLQITEVTQGQWQAVMGNNPSKFDDCGETCPVENVSWVDAQDFIARLNAMDDANRYRLPTEAEWEYACRAGTTTRYFWGDEADCQKANYGNSGLSSECKNISPGKPAPVGSYQANPWGLYDMHGNVWEWCEDIYDEYESASAPGPERLPDEKKRVLRGGAYFDPAESCRAANRCWELYDYRLMDIGFRLVRSLR